MKQVSRQQSGPFQILKSGHSRIRDIRRANILTIGKVSDSIKTMFGPCGMHKMLVSPKGEVTIASDGLAIINNMVTSSPITKLLIEAVRTQHELAGDGTKTVVILAGELLKKAEHLLKMKVHPTAIMGGYNKARKRALETLESIGMRVSLNDRALLQRIASTAIGGRLSG
ncbi:MAG TPA: TCP-1/cpn60 chaperonin family protein, partial [Candidatus Methanomethylicus sp.]|nr:TCP-1/cpn60 chaperonin family protein [Candidatus Methanomethylicus sp.]